VTEASEKAIFPVECISENNKRYFSDTGHKSLNVKKTPLKTSEMIIRIIASFKVKNVFVP